MFRKVFGEDFEPYNGSRQFHITPLNLQVFLVVVFFLFCFLTMAPNFSFSVFVCVFIYPHIYVLCVFDTGGLLSPATQWWSSSCPGSPTVHHTSGSAPAGVPDQVCGEGLDDHTGWPHSQWKDQPCEAVGSADGTQTQGHGYEQFHGHHRAAGGL